MSSFLDLSWLVVQLAVWSMLFLVVSAFTIVAVLAPPFVVFRWIRQAMRGEPITR